MLIFALKLTLKNERRMSSINTNATVTLTVNGKQAEDMLVKLKAQASNLENAIEKAAKAGNKQQLPGFRNCEKRRLPHGRRMRGQRGAVRGGRRQREGQRV